MKLFKIEDFKGGWFIGDFEPTAYRTAACEVCRKLHHKGEKWDKHFHRVATEINCIISGTMTLKDTLLQTGDVFVLEPNEIADPEFLSDCLLIVVKVPSIPGDKYVV